jgi:hypothetical protein
MYKPSRRTKARIVNAVRCHPTELRCRRIDSSATLRCLAISARCMKQIDVSRRTMASYFCDMLDKSNCV